MTEKKLKIASENIRMSDELKERIMKKCETNAEHISSDGYTDHVYQVETVKPRKWLKVISGIAACAVIAGGVGAGVVYMSRQGAPSAELDDVETTQEVSDTVEETSPKCLVIDDIMDYRFIDDSLNDYVQPILTVLGEYLENNEITEGDAIPSLMQVGMDFSNGSRELHIYENNILTTVDEEGKITYYNIDSRKLFEALDKVMFVANDLPDNMNIKDVTDEEGVYTAGGILSEYFNRENIRMYVYCDNMDMYTPAMILNGEEPKIGFSEPIELTDEMQYVIVDYMDEQTSCEPPECMSFNTYIAVIDENDSEHPLAKVTFYDEGCMAFEIQKDDNTLVRYWMTGNVTGFGKLNGSSSMATTCAGTLALMDAGVPIKNPVAGIAMGLIKNPGEDKYAILSDILGDEDHLGDMDFKTTGTKNGLTATQMDIKCDGLSYEILEKALLQAKAGREHIMGEMMKTISEPRSEFKPQVPRIEQIIVPKDFIGAIIGPGGKNIQQLQEETNTVITIDEEDGVGKVQISAPDKTAIDAAMSRIKGIIAIPEVGEVYESTVKSIMPYGCFVEFLPGKEGLLHISEIEWKHLESVEEAGIHEGDSIQVKLVGTDSKTGKFKLSHRVLTEKPEGYVERERPQRPARQPREDGENHRPQRQHGERPQRQPHFRHNDNNEGEKANDTEVRSALDDLLN